MIVEITNGIGAIRIGQCNMGSYFKYEKPIISVLHDCLGSVGKYLALLPYSKECREKLQESINESLYKDFTGIEDELKDLLDPLLQLMPNGKYSINYFNGSDQIHCNSWDVIFGRMTEILETNKIKNLYNRFIEEYEGDPISILEFSSYNHYSPYHLEYVATQSLDTIDYNHVRYLGRLIEGGERPSVILFKNSIAGCPSSTYYVIDGHHKLLAYRNLVKPPSVIEITSLNENMDTVEFDLEELAMCLYPWQVEHILNRWDDKGAYLDKALLNPNSILHGMVKNGLVREYYKNGRLKTEAYYINDCADGVLRGWHENGQIAYEHTFKKGIETGIWKRWNEKGEIIMTHGYDELGRYHGSLRTYYDNGQIRSETVYNHGFANEISSCEWYRSGKVKK